MNLSRKIDAALEARLGPDAPPCTMSVEDGPHRLTLQLTATGPVAWPFASST